MEVDFQMIGSMSGVALSFAAVVDRVWGPQSLRLKALEDRMHQQDLTNQKFGIHGDELEKAITKLTEVIERLRDQEDKRPRI